MKKILSLALVLVMVLSVAALVGCSGDKKPAGNDAAGLKFGLGVVANYGKATDAEGETNGAGEFNTTAVAVLLDAEGKIVSIDLDTAQIKPSWTSEGKFVAATELRTKYEQGADYLGVGAIYPTTTKVKTVITSTDTLSDICNAVPVAVNTIGGLNKDNIDILKSIPIAGICVVSAIMKADDPKKASEELKEKAKELGLC